MKRVLQKLLALSLVGVGLPFGCRDREAERHSAGGQDPGPMPVVALPQHEAQRVNKIEIQKGGAERLVLEKRDGKWLLTAPVQSPAKAASVAELISNATEIKLKENISKTADDYAAYQLDDAKAVHAVAWVGQAKVFDPYFGKSGTRGHTVKLSDRPGVWVANGYSSYLWTRETKQWQGSDAQAVSSAPEPRAAIENCQNDCYNLWARCGAACVINEEGELCSKRCRAARAECDDACTLRAR